MAMETDATAAGRDLVATLSRGIATVTDGESDVNDMRSIPARI